MIRRSQVRQVNLEMKKQKAKGNYCRNKIQDEKSQEETLIDRIWHLYKRILTFPANTDGIEKKIGMFLYITSLAIAVCFIVMIYMEPTSYYTEGYMLFEDEIESYQTPDIIICPPLQHNSIGKFIILPDDHDLEAIGLSSKELETLAKMKYNACGEHSECLPLNAPCDKFFDACENLQAILREYTDDRDYLESDLDYKQPYIHYIWSKNNDVLTFEMLWLYSLDHDFLKIPHSYSGNPSGYYHKLEELDEILNFDEIEYNTNFKQIWVEKSFCWLLPSIFVSGKQSNGRFLDDLYGYRIWIGNLKTETVFHLQQTEEKALYPRVLYSSIEYHRKAQTGAVCKGQPLIRGISLGCNESRDAETLIYYKWRQGSETKYSWDNSRSELHLSSREFIEEKKVFSSYSKFQITVSLLSCCVGHSVLQIVYLILGKLQRQLKLTATIENFLVLTTLFFLSMTSIVLGRIDLSIYLNNRYNLVFKQKNIGNWLPIVELHSNTSIFINCSMVSQYGLTKELAEILDLEYYGFLSSQCHVETGFGGENVTTEIISGARLLKIRQEAEVLSQKLGLGNEKGPADLINAFTPEIDLFIQNCTVGDISVSCIELAEFHRMSETSMVLAMHTLEGNDHHRNESSAEIGSLSFSIDSQFIRDRIAEDLEASDSWLIEIHPNNYINETVEKILYFDTFAFQGYGVQNIAIKTRFRDQLPSRDDRKCVDENERILKSPYHDIIFLLRSAHSNYWCGCIHCPPSATRNRQLQLFTRFFSSSSVTCCSILDVIDCYEKYTLDEKTAGSLEPNESAKNISYLQRGIELRLLRDVIGSLRDGNISVLSDDMLSRLIGGFEVMKDQIKNTLRVLLEKHTQPACQQYWLQLSSVKKKKPDKRYIDITITQKSSAIKGVVEVDRFNLSDFVGVISCSFSFIFGVGVVGICEIIMSSCQLCRRGKRKTKRLIREHLMRSMEVFSCKVRISPDHGSESLGNKELAVRFENTFGDNSSAIVPSPYHPEKDNCGETKHGEAPSGHRKTQDQERKFSVRELHVKDLEKNVVDDENELDTSYEETCKTPSTKPSVASLFRSKPQLSPGSSGHGSAFGSAMLLILGLSMVGMIFVSLMFFESAKDDEFNTIVVSEPLYQSPSVIICAKRGEDAKNLVDLMSGSRCTVGNNTDDTSCSLVFKVFFKNTEDLPCVLYDNRETRKMNPGEPDIQIDFPSAEDVAISIHEAGSPLLYGGYRPVEFKFAAVLYYQIVIVKRHSGCITERNASILRFCRENWENERGPCCITNSTCFEPGHNYNPCMHHTFDTELFHQDWFGDYERFIIRPKFDFALETQIRQKYDFLMVFSIVGGFVGGFVEMTLLNCISIFFLILCYCAKKFNFSSQ